MTEQIGPRAKKVRGMAQRSLDLIEAMHDIAEACQPISARGVCYKLFSAKLIASMGAADIRPAYRLLKIAREQGDIPWEWIVDETRSLESRAMWSDPESFMQSASRSYCRDLWQTQPCRLEIWSEKGTVRGVLEPVLAAYGVGFRVMHGFASATAVYDAAQEGDEEQPLVVLYVGDYDPSGMFMSERDLPTRLAEYGGEHIDFRRIALVEADMLGLESFPASDKRDDKRYKWFVENFGALCWELDAMDPNDLRSRVKDKIEDHLDLTEWNRAHAVNRAEQDSLRAFFNSWGAA